MTRPTPSSPLPSPPARPPRPTPAALRVTLAALALVLLFGAGCGHGLFGWNPFQAAPAPPEPVALEVPGAWLDASDVPHVSVFYDALAPHGVWTRDLEDEALGWVWTPSDTGYVPYADGRWVETEAGPTFLCDTPFGWAVTHYGRWMHRDRWYWVPDTRWGPAWVSWRVGDGLIGWAPLRPDSVRWPLPDTAWRFVAAVDFWQPAAARKTYAAGHIPWLMASTRPLERTATTTRTPFVVGPEVRFAGWRARKVPLSGLPQARVRWVPRWEQGERPGSGPGPALGVLPQSSVRAGPAAPQRYGRKAPMLVVPRLGPRPVSPGQRARPPATAPRLRARPPAPPARTVPAPPRAR